VRRFLTNYFDLLLVFRDTQYEDELAQELRANYSHRAAAYLAAGNRARPESLRTGGLIHAVYLLYIGLLRNSNN